MKTIKTVMAIILILFMLQIHVKAEVIFFYTGVKIYRPYENITYIIGENLTFRWMNANTMTFNNSPRLIFWNSTVKITNKIVGLNTTLSTSNNTNVTINTVKMEAIPPAENWVTIVINKFDLSSSGELINFTANTIDGVKITFIIWGLKPNTNYLIKKDGSNFKTVASNSSGYLTFSNVDWSSHTFTIQIAPAPTATPSPSVGHPSPVGAQPVKTTPPPPLYPPEQEVNWWWMLFLVILLVVSGYAALLVYDDWRRGKLRKI